MEGPIPELRAAALRWLLEKEPAAKVEGVGHTAASWSQGGLALAPDEVFAPSGEVPGRPPRPELVPPTQLRARSMHTVEGRSVMLHALAHIEFNAINLALDAIWRFAGMP